MVLRRPLQGAVWEQECDFVGHNSPVVCCSFSPSTYSRKPTSSGSRGETAYFCCALGGQDCHVSVWVTSKAKPLVVVRDLFDQDVLDLAWTPDGYHLLACSMDGTLAVVSLSSDELGHQLSPSECEARLRGLYGDAATSIASGLDQAGGLLESAALLNLEASAACNASVEASAMAGKLR